MSNAFDASAFLSATLAPSATETKPIPMGLYPASITKVDIKIGEAGPTAKTPGAPWARIDVTWDIDDDHLRQSLGRSAVVVVQGIMLDLDTDGQPATGDGKNVRLGRLRKATGCNNGNESLLSLIGRQARIEINHRMYNDTVQADVKNVAAI
jgi:hypothetical protein